MEKQNKKHSYFLFPLVAGIISGIIGFLYFKNYGLVVASFVAIESVIRTFVSVVLATWIWRRFGKDG